MILAMYMLVGLGFTALRGFFWAAWLILLAFAILHIFLVCGSCVAIGSDWFKSDTGPRWIDPTHLTSVKLRMSTFETMVVLRDDAERWVEVSLDDLGRGRSVRQAFATALAESGARGLVLDPAIAARLPLDTTFQARVRESWPFLMGPMPANCGSLLRRGGAWAGSNSIRSLREAVDAWRASFLPDDLPHFGRSLWWRAVK
jgi:hypothetical protein